MDLKILWNLLTELVQINDQQKQLNKKQALEK